MKSLCFSLLLVVRAVVFMVTGTAGTAVFTIPYTKRPHQVHRMSVVASTATETTTIVKRINISTYVKISNPPAFIYMTSI